MQTIILTCNRSKNYYDNLRFFHAVFKIQCVFELTAHLPLDRPHLQGSVATCVQWPLCWAVQHWTTLPVSEGRVGVVTIWSGGKHEEVMKRSNR